MNKKEFEIFIEELKALPCESEWVEFKVDNANPQIIGEYISTLSNSAEVEKTYDRSIKRFIKENS